MLGGEMFRTATLAALLSLSFGCASNPHLRGYWILFPIKTLPGEEALPAPPEEEAAFVEIVDKVAHEYGMHAVPVMARTALSAYETQRAPDGSLLKGKTIRVYSNSYGLQIAIAELPRGLCPSREFRDIIDALKALIYQEFPKRPLEEKWN